MSFYVAVEKSLHVGRLIGWTDCMREALGNRRPLLEQADIDRDVAAVVTKIGRDAFHEAYNKGRTMTLDEAVKYVLDG